MNECLTFAKDYVRNSYIILMNYICNFIKIIIGTVCAVLYQHFHPITTLMLKWRVIAGLCRLVILTGLHTIYGYNLMYAYNVCNSTMYTLYAPLSK